MIDENLFLHDLAVVAILKCEAPYLKEWLDYHLAAGVDHFYLYDNESPDNQAEVAKPYVKAGLVDYFFAPGKVMQCAAYNDAVKRFKFQSRYMAFIDGDEFIYPKNRGGGAITDVVDEILSRNTNATGLAINWIMFSSNGHETADNSRGVLERFTRHVPNYENEKSFLVKTVANPRAINFSRNAHFSDYLEGAFSINEDGQIVQGQETDFLCANKIVVNHYHTKSREEYLKKVSRGPADGNVILYEEYANATEFEPNGYDGTFDDGILHYRNERMKTYQPPDKSRADERLFNALTKNLSPTLIPNTPPDFYAGKLETFLTCRAVAAYLKTKLTDEEPAKFFEEAALKAILNSLSAANLTEARMLIRELPDLLSLPYPAVKDLRGVCLQIIPQIMNIMRVNIMWKDYVEFDYLQRLLKIFEE